MSKAFTREDDVKELAPIRPLPTLPPGVKNYITPEGEQNLRAELARATSKEQAARLEQILSTITVAQITPAAEARFGAIVKVKYPGGEVEDFRIVGINEIDLDRNFISWQSPLAKALTGAKAGDTISFRAPAGPQKLVILEVKY